MSVQMTIPYKIELQAPQSMHNIGTLINQGDSDAHKILLELYDDGRAADLSAYVVEAELDRADGHTVQLNGIINGNTISVTLGPACYAVQGPAVLTVRIDGDERRTVFKAGATVDPENTGEWVVDESYGSLAEIINAAVQDYLQKHPIHVEEIDPTVSEWAKQASKPAYTKSEVGLANVENVRQYSQNNPPPYPVTSVNGQTGDVQLPTGGGGGDVNVDSTLTVAGAAADSKTVGDRFGNMLVQLQGRAPKYHASAEDIYGIGTANMYGHVKAAYMDKMLGRGLEAKGQDPNQWYTMSGELVGDVNDAQQYLTGVVPNMFLLSVFNDLLNVEFDHVSKNMEILESEQEKTNGRVLELEKGGEIVTDATVSVPGAAADAAAVRALVETAREAVLRMTARLYHADQHAKDADDPITPEMIGAAPAGNYVKTINGNEPDASGNVNVEVGSNVNVDTTLSVEGAAADAAAVGDKFTETNQTINKKALEILQSRAAAVHADQHRCTDTITWDGNTEGYATVEWGEPEYGITLARVWQGEIPTELLNRDVVVNNHDPDGMLIPDEDMFYEHTKYRFEAVGDGAYIIKGTFYASVIGELEEDEYGFIYAGWYTTKPNTTVQLFDAEYVTLPETGIYLAKTSFDGSICYTKSLTIPNHDFGNSTDPLTPEMISAAPKNHASETDAYGVADARLYGHVKNSGLESAIYQGDTSKGQDFRKWYDGNGEVVANNACEASELLLGKSISASFFWIMYYSILSSELLCIEDELSYFYRYCDELDDRLSALGG